MSTQKKKNVSHLSGPTSEINTGKTCSMTWADIEEVLSDEWEIGGSPMKTEAVTAGD